MHCVFVGRIRIHTQVIWKDAEEEAARKGAQLAAEKEQERKRKYQEVEEEAEAEEDGFECYSFISACANKKSSGIG